MSDRLVLACSQLKNVNIEEGHDTRNDGQQRSPPMYSSKVFACPLQKHMKETMFAHANQNNKNSEGVHS